MVEIFKDIVKSDSFVCFSHHEKTKNAEAQIFVTYNNI
jgi:hypothetical protein